jgi:hypothetical protein
MGKTDAMKWFPLDVDSWLYGSTRLELAADECAVWIDFLALGAKDNGHIRANIGFPYPIPALAGLLGRPVELIERTIDKCLRIHSADPDEKPKLTKLGDGTLYITNWENYQFSKRWVRKLNKMCESPDSSAETERGSGKTEPYNIVSSNVLSHKKKSEIQFDAAGRRWIGIEPEDIDRWKSVYPACDIPVELDRMIEWLLANPTKTKSNYRRFIVNWLSRTQDRGGSSPSARTPSSEMRVGANPKREWTLDEWQRTRDLIERNVRSEGMRQVIDGKVTTEKFERRVAEVMADWDRDHPKPGGRQ